MCTLSLLSLARTLVASTTAIAMTACGLDNAVVTNGASDDDTLRAPVACHAEPIQPTAGEPYRVVADGLPRSKRVRMIVTDLERVQSISGASDDTGTLFAAVDASAAGAVEAAVYSVGAGDRLLARCVYAVVAASLPSDPSPSDPSPSDPSPSDPSPSDPSPSDPSPSDPSPGTSPSAGGTLQFESGFESGTYVEGTLLKGIDSSAVAAANDWGRLSTYLPWVTRANAYYEGGSMSIATDPVDPSNRVLHFHNTAAAGAVCRTQWTLKQVHEWVDPNPEAPNLFAQQYYRFRVLIPQGINRLYTTAERADWYMIWESHAWEDDDARHGIYLRKNPGNDFWHFQVMQQRPEGGPILWQNLEQQNIAVPFGEWFTLHIFFKYDPTEGEFFAAIERSGQARQTLGRYQGQTQFGVKLHDQMIFKMYHDAVFIPKMQALGYDGVHQYYDDLEIWSDYPPGFWD